ncbi:MAG: hypothetical protein WC312_00420 [Candidatus Omnitrophota bacterium]|jgi:hypothetical protein
MKKMLNCSIAGFEPIVDVCGFIDFQPLVLCEQARTQQKRRISHHGKRKK